MTELSEYPVTIGVASMAGVEVDAVEESGLMLPVVEKKKERKEDGAYESQDAFERVGRAGIR